MSTCVCLSTLITEHLQADIEAVDAAQSDEEPEDVPVLVQAISPRSNSIFPRRRSGFEYREEEGHTNRILPDDDPPAMQAFRERINSANSGNSLRLGSGRLDLNDGSSDHGGTSPMSLRRHISLQNRVQLRSRDAVSPRPVSESFHDGSSRATKAVFTAMVGTHLAVPGAMLPKAASASITGREFAKFVERAEKEAAEDEKRTEKAHALFVSMRRMPHYSVHTRARTRAHAHSPSTSLFLASTYSHSLSLMHIHIHIHAHSVRPPLFL
jgi:hypothetical protein